MGLRKSESFHDVSCLDLMHRKKMADCINLKILKFETAVPFEKHN